FFSSRRRHTRFSRDWSSDVCSSDLKGSDRLWAYGFRFYFTPLSTVLFTFPSRYWFTIGLSGVFSLAGWCRPIQTGFLRSRPTQGTRVRKLPARTGPSPSTARLPRRFRSAVSGPRGPYNPGAAVTAPVWALPVSLATTPGIIVIFSSSGYHASCMVGCPIRKPADRLLFADPRRLSQLIASFIASESLGIPHTPLFTSFAHWP